MPEWSNPSVAALATERDPRVEITRSARALVADAMDRGWSGPPYDPFALAEILGFPVSPAEDIPEAQIYERSWLTTSKCTYTMLHRECGRANYRDQRQPTAKRRAAQCARLRSDHHQ
jgi:hypothetical protein